MRQIIKRQKQEKEQITSSDLVSRDVAGNIENYLRQDIIKVVTGVRRSGKSIFCFMALNGTDFGYVNFDEKEVTDLKNYDEILRYVQEFYGDIKCLFLDEVQNLDDWELWVNSLQRRGYNLLITGSNAKLLSREMATHLTGRHISVELFPFSFREYLDAVGFDIKEDYMEEERGMILNHLKKYMEIGGFPEVVVKGYDYKYLQTLFDSIILKDVVQRHDVRYADDLYNLARFLMSSFSNEISYTKLKNTLNFRSVNTVKNYIKYLEDTYLIFHLDRFSFKQREQINSPKKVYAIDTGMANALAFSFSENIGNLMENTVAVELLRQISGASSRLEMYYWKDSQQREIDFVIKEGPNVLQLIQVCYDIDNPKTKERELRSLIGAAKELDCSDLLVITWDREIIEEFKGNNIRFVPLWKWLQVIDLQH
jgi:predicted AAA+ superfamily ATPase